SDPEQLGRAGLGARPGRHRTGGRPRRLPEARERGRMNIEKRLSELGLTLPVVSKPVAAYVPAIVTGNLVYTSGQLPFVDGALPATGKVGAEVSAEDAAGYARTCALNGLAAAAS